MRLSRADMDIKPINKRASGQAFEVILKPTSPVTDAAHCITSPPKRDLSLDDIQKKLEAAEDRRRVRMLPLVAARRNLHVLTSLLGHTCCDKAKLVPLKDPISFVKLPTSCGSPTYQSQHQ